MKNNLFEDLQAKKERLRQLASKAVEYGWIDSPKKEEFINKLDKEVLTIGVIGQMKCGKSTFLNSFVFEEDILPAATTPMTAALSVITYGVKKEVVAEFYSKDEWEEQKMQAMRSLDEVAGNPLEKSKVKAAKELVKSSSKLGDSLNSHLGKTKVDSLDNLKEYVGADGKYVSITKSVTIHYPKEYLKGVEIVDTPGFNDPVASREERTKSFLRKADVVLLMLYAGRPFDATDREILFKHVAQCGMGKVLIGINKYDVHYNDGESEEQIKECVSEQLSRAIKEYDDNYLCEIMESSELLTLSAEMALLSELPMNRIVSKKAYKDAWNRYCDIFEISTQLQMRDKSHIDFLIAKVKQVIELEKDRILYNKLINTIKVAGHNRKHEIETNKQECCLLIDTLNQPDEEIEKRQRNIERAERRLKSRIRGLETDISDILEDAYKNVMERLDDIVRNSCDKMDEQVNQLKKLSSPQSIMYKLERELESLRQGIKMETYNISRSTRNEIRTTTSDFVSKAWEIFVEYLPGFEPKDFFETLKADLNLKIDTDFLKNLSLDYNNDDNDDLGNLFNKLTFGIGNMLKNFFNHENNLNILHDCIASIRKNDLTSNFRNSFLNNEDFIVENVEKRLIDEVIRPLENELNEIIKCKSKREEKLANLKSKHESILKDEKKLKEELEAISALL